MSECCLCDAVGCTWVQRQQGQRRHQPGERFVREESRQVLPESAQGVNDALDWEDLQQAMYTGVGIVGARVLISAV